MQVMFPKLLKTSAEKMSTFRLSMMLMKTKEKGVGRGVGKSGIR
jgi:hypothetical protein